MIGDAFFLLVGLVVFFIDHDQLQLAERQEQRRARADNDARPARRHFTPHTAARGGASRRVPLCGDGSETLFEARRHRLRQRNLGQQDEHLRLRVATQRLGDGFEIDLGLARPGDTIEQRYAKGILAHHLAKISRRLKLFAGEIARWALGIGQRKGLIQRALDLRERARIDETLHHAG